MFVVLVMVIVTFAFGMLVMLVMVIVTFTFGMFVMLASNRVDAVSCLHPEAAEVRSIDQPVQPALELQPIDDKDLRLADGSRIGRGRPVNVRIPVGADECRDFDMLSADALHHVAEDREGSHHRNRPVGLCDDRNGERQREDGGGG